MNTGNVVFEFGTGSVRRSRRGTVWSDCVPLLSLSFGSVPHLAVDLDRRASLRSSAVFNVRHLWSLDRHCVTA